MKILKYLFQGNPVEMSWNEINEGIAQREADNGEYAVEDNGVEDVPAATWQDTIEAQVAYTAMMTDTLLEV